jgi:hypothetical protein
MVDQIDVKFGAETQVLLKALDDVKAKVKELGSGIQNDMAGGEAGVKQATEALNQQGIAGAALSGLLKGLFGPALFVGLVAGARAAQSAVTELGKAAEITSASLKDLQGIQFAAQAGAGIGAGAALASIEKFATRLHDAVIEGGKLKEFLNDNSVSLIKADGSAKSLTDQMSQFSRLVYNAKDGFEQIKILEAVGLTKEWLDVLNQSPEAFQAAIAESERLGLTITSEQIEKNKEFEQKWNAMTARWSTEFKHAIVEISEALSKMASVAIEVISLLNDAWKLVNNENITDNRSPLVRLRAAAGLDENGNTAPPPVTIKPDKASPKTDASSLYSDKSGAADSNNDALRAAMKEVDGEIQALQAGLARKKVILDAEVAAHRMTQDQKFAALQTETESEYQAQMALLQKELLIGGLSLNQRQQINNKIKALENKHSMDMLQLNIASVQAQQRIWEGYFNTITGAFNSQLRGLLAGTTSFATAFKNIIGDLIISFIQGCERMATDWLAGQIAQRTATVATKETDVAAKTAAAAEGAVLQKATAMGAVSTNVAQAFAGFSAFFAPLLGPGAIPAATGLSAEVAAQSTAMMAIPSFDVGALNLSADQVAKVHKGEMIIPAGWADNVRAMMSGQAPMGGQGGGGHTFNIHLTNQGGISDADIRAKGRILAQTIRDQLRLNPSLRPAF